MEATTPRPTNLTETQAMDTIAAMRTEESFKVALRRQWITNAPGARFSVLAAYLRQNGLR